MPRMSGIGYAGIELTTFLERPWQAFPHPCRMNVLTG